MFFALVALSGVAVAADDDVLGTYWLPGPDRDGQVEIYEKGGVYEGRISWFVDPNAVDENNPDPELRKQALVGSFVFEKFEYNEKKDRWENGTIYDGGSGSVYKSRMWFEDGDLGVLMVRGYIGAPLFGRTEKFIRVPANEINSVE